MRNRLDVQFQGKRTTARFPSYLWRLALVASRLDDEQLADRLRSVLRGWSQTSLSASGAAQGFLVNLIEMELFAAGFNPGTSRAHSSGPTPDHSAAGASPTRLNSEAARGTPRPS